MQGNKQKGKNFGKPLSVSSLLSCVTAITNLYFVFPSIMIYVNYFERSKGTRVRIFIHVHGRPVS